MDKMNPRDVILKGLAAAKKDNTVRYVQTARNGFKVVKDQPPPTRSHWRIQPDGTLHAHTEAYPTATEYKYELCNDQESPERPNL